MTADKSTPRSPDDHVLMEYMYTLPPVRCILLSLRELCPDDRFLVVVTETKSLGTSVLADGISID